MYKRQAEGRAAAQIVGTRQLGGACLLGSARAHAQYELTARALTHIARTYVALSHMYAVRAAFKGYVQAVVDYQRHAVAMGMPGCKRPGINVFY